MIVAFMAKTIHDTKKYIKAHYELNHSVSMRPALVRIWSLSAVVIVERAELTTPTGLFRF